MEKVKRFVPLNFELISNPVNWLIIILMVLVAGLALSYIVSHTVKPSESN